MNDSFYFIKKVNYLYITFIMGFITKGKSLKSMENVMEKNYDMNRIAFECRL